VDFVTSCIYSLQSSTGLTGLTGIIRLYSFNVQQLPTAFTGKSMHMLLISFLCINIYVLLMRDCIVGETGEKRTPFCIFNV